MKIAKILLGFVAAVVLLGGGYMAGRFITQTHTGNLPAQQFIQPTFIPQQQIQPTLVPQQQFQPTVVPQQLQATPFPPTTPPAVPPQGQWGRGWWMADPNYVTQGAWDQWCLWGYYYAPQGQQGPGTYGWNDNGHWNNMPGGMMDGYGMYGYGSNGYGMNGYGSQSYNYSYPTPTTAVSFKINVLPIFAARCVACHGGTDGLYVDTYQNIMRGGVDGAVVFPGNVSNSRLAYYVYSGYMPFRTTPLTPAEIQTILDWIALGAPDN